MRFWGEISSMTSDLNQPENHFQDISRTCRKVIDEVKHGHNPKTSISAHTTLHWIERYCKVLESIAAKYRRLGPDRAELLLPVALPSSKTNRHVPYTSNTQPIQYQRNIALISFPNTSRSISHCNCTRSKHDTNPMLSPCFPGQECPLRDTEQCSVNTRTAISLPNT